jgi:hypothetical protein
MKSIEEFESFFQNQLYSSLQELEQIRKQSLKKGISFLFFTLLLAAAVIFLISNTSEENYSVIIGTAGLLFIGVGIYIFKNFKGSGFRNRFKKEVIEPIVLFVSPELKYYPELKVNQGDFVKSRLFLNKIDRYRGDDFVEGKIDKTAFHFSELHVEYKTTSTDDKGNKKTTWHTVFKGLFFTADFNKDFKGSTVLLPNYFGKGLSILKKVFGMNRREKLVKLEDPEFSKHFNCYSDDDVKARYILSPALMQRINQFKTKFPKNPVFISFVDSQIFIAISHQKDLFEPSYFSSILKFETIKSYFEDIKFAVDIVEELNLNTRIWTKE